ncbi:MAG: hypothetical protein K0U67_01870, partial [Actinomycetia bacterium]|nr:hypothetical protein [Actinomycetes bacterium]
MRRLTTLGAAAVLLAAGIGSTPLAGADPTATEPTSTEPTSTGPTSTEPADTEPTSTEPTGTEAADTGVAATEPGGARQVTYTVTTTSDLTANIYYVTADPPDQ